MLEWIQQNQKIVWLVVASLAGGAVGMIAACATIVLLPPDYFQQQTRARGASKDNQSDSSPVWRIARSIVGWLLVVAGIAMLILPGPGLVVILIGVMLADFPGKYRVQRWIISRGGILKSANWMRNKFGKPPFKIDRKGTKKAAKKKARGGGPQKRR